jgi:hypothetical protein
LEDPWGELSEEDCKISAYGSAAELQKQSREQALQRKGDIERYLS